MGLAGLGQTTRYAALVWLGPLLLLIAAMFAPSFAVLRIVWIMGVGFAGILAIGGAFEAAERAKRDRPSDVVLDANGLTIDGAEGRKLTWQEVDAASCSIVSDEPRLAVRFLLLSWITFRKIAWLVARSRVDVYQLKLPLRAGGDDVILAEGEEQERASLEALRDSIRSAGATTEAEDTAPLPPELVRCGSCGAPQVPLDVDAAPCPFCGHAVSMPAALREKQRAVAELRTHDASSARVITELVEQPSARSAAGVLWLGRKLLVWTQPLALVLLVVLLYHQTETRHGVEGIYVWRVSETDDPVFFYDLAVLALMVACAFGVVWAALSSYFAKRMALRVLVESFGAVPPAKAGAPSTCRQCGAPLATSSELLVRCVYCSAQNVLGVDPRPRAARRRHEIGDLAVAVRARRRAQVRFAVTVPICALAAIGVVREVALAWWVPQRDTTSGFCLGHCGSSTTTISYAEPSRSRTEASPFASRFSHAGRSCGSARAIVPSPRARPRNRPRAARTRRRRPSCSRTVSCTSCLDSG